MSNDESDGVKALIPPTAKREMARRNAQDHFAASQRRDSEVRKEIERQQAATSAQITKLRALRLAKEEADRLDAINNPPVKVRKTRAR